MKNYYQIIGVNTTADFTTIKNEYLRKIKKYHPDIYVGDKSFAMQKTAELNEAYNVLKDEKLREQYDLANNIKEGKKSIQSNDEINVFKDLGGKIKTFFTGLKSDLVNFGKKHKKKSRVHERKHSSKKLTPEQLKDKKDQIVRTIVILALIGLLIGIIILLNVVS